MLEKQNGFTIIELLVGMSITAIILAATASLITSILPAWQKNASKSELEQTLRIGIDAVIRDARYAKTMDITQDGNGIYRLKLETDSDIIEFKLNPATKALGKEMNNDGGFQPIAGDGTGNSQGNIVIIDNPSGEPMFYKDSNIPKLLAINITAMDRKTSAKLTMRTKIFCRNVQ